MQIPCVQHMSCSCGTFTSHADMLHTGFHKEILWKVGPSRIQGVLELINYWKLFLPIKITIKMTYLKSDVGNRAQSTVNFSSSSCKASSLLSVNGQRAQQPWEKWYQGERLQRRLQWCVASLYATSLTFPLNFSFLSLIFNKLVSWHFTVMSFQTLVYCLTMKAQEKRKAPNAPLLCATVLYIGAEHCDFGIKPLWNWEILLKTGMEICWVSTLCFRQWKVSSAQKGYERSSELENPG